MHLVPYLNFDGNCREACEFYATALGGRIEDLMTFGDSPMADQTPPDLLDKVMNVSIRVGDAWFMASDAMPGHYEEPSGTFICLVNDDVSEAERIFRALEEGGRVVMPFQPTFWAKRFGMVKDRFGTPWMLNCGDARDGEEEIPGHEAAGNRSS